MNSGTGIYKSGVLAFFAGAILIGALLGAVTFFFMGSDELSMLSVFSHSFVDVRSSGDLEEILVRSFFSSTVFLAVVFLSGFSSLGQPLAVAVLLLRGMGWGVAMSQLYSIYGGVCTSSCGHNSGGTYDSRKGSCCYVKYPAVHCFF